MCSVCSLKYDEHQVPRKKKHLRLRSITGHVGNYHGEKKVRSKVTTKAGKSATLEVNYSAMDVTRPAIAVNDAFDQKKAV